MILNTCEPVLVKKEPMECAKKNYIIIKLVIKKHFEFYTLK